MIAMTTVQAREHFSDVINRSAYGGERIVLQRHGKNLAAVVSMEDFELLQVVENYVDVQDAKAALKEARRLGTVSLATLKAELGL